MNFTGYCDDDSSFYLSQKQQHTDTDFEHFIHTLVSDDDHSSVVSDNDPDQGVKDVHREPSYANDNHQNFSQTSLINAFFERRAVEVSSLYKTRICMYHAQSPGGCPVGDRCTFAHDLTELRPRPNLSHTALCRFYNLATGTHTCRRSVCKYAHSVSTLRIDPRYTHITREFGNFSIFAGQKSPAALAGLHTIKRISSTTFVTTCEHCGKFCRICAQPPPPSSPPPPPHQPEPMPATTAPPAATHAEPEELVEL